MAQKLFPVLPFDWRPALALVTLLGTGGCAVGPDYQRPTAALPAAFKEAAGWKTATPNDAAERGPWWEVFQDPLLNDLEAQAATANQSLLIAAANYEQARQLARADRTTLLPTISLSGSAQRSKSASSHAGATTSSAPANSFSASAGASWTPDFWGRVRRLNESDLAAAEVSAADLALSRLSVQSTLAQSYIQLRIADEKIRLRENAVTAYRRTLTIAQNKYKVGIAARSDVISAQALLDAARAQAVDAGVQRAQLEHAVAVLVGKPPGDFTLTPQPALTFSVPDLPLRLPGDLLERRPDIAAAERSVAAANARVGVQTAAYFPDLTLSATGGFQGPQFAHLFSTPDRFWSLGASLADSLLDFGRRGDQIAAARAAYDANVASYRRTVLGALQEVEDDLASLRLLESEAQIQNDAVTEAAEAARIALNEYNAGTVDFTTVVTAQVTELNDRQTALTILQNRLIASVALTEALGGGWTTHDLPGADQVYARTASAPMAAKK
jgi:NodT family efflux transporter outer membrane factor (OMF) lipoprotein